ncbi:hypothetical protein VNI00_006877 [Paramarasmius palmivorus]|uniref:HNH nuclease domain-containing protein n=1 Tax=Paramarasmius palmivorus TaxID=297713 RepID=A0AAW0D4B7_9AGAR
MPFANLPSTPLPNPGETLTSCTDDVRGAYARVFEVQQHSSAMKEKLYARILGYLLINLDRFSHTLGENPLTYVSREINRPLCDGKRIGSVVSTLGSLYLQLFGAFLHQEPRPIIRDDSFDGSTKKLALIRDGFRCLATSTIDDPYGTQSDSLATLARAGTSANETQPCHIFGNLTDCDHECRTSTMNNILSNFGLAIQDDLQNRGNVHDIRNILTLKTECRIYFDQLEIWFEPTVTNHEYEIYYAQEWRQQSLRLHDTVTFKVHDFVFANTVDLIETMKRNPHEYLPDPKLLALHATCARVAHMSGAAELLQQWDLDLEDKGVLASDGSDMDVFSHAMSKLFSVTVH